MINTEVRLVCKRVKFYSHKDEAAFFEWIKKITCINTIKGIADTLVLNLSNSDIHDDELRDLITLFRRYKINTKQLEIFLNENNRSLFDWCKKGFSINVYPVQK